MYLYFAVSQGETGKMSASDPISAIYVIDSAKDIKNKVCFQHIAVILFISKKKYSRNAIPWQMQQLSPLI